VIANSTLDDKNTRREKSFEVKVRQAIGLTAAAARQGKYFYID